METDWSSFPEVDCHNGDLCPLKPSRLTTVAPQVAILEQANEHPNFNSAFSIFLYYRW